MKNDYSELYDVWGSYGGGYQDFYHLENDAT
jgi:hypothetical protein